MIAVTGLTGIGYLGLFSDYVIGGLDFLAMDLPPYIHVYLLTVVKIFFGARA